MTLADAQLLAVFAFPWIWSSSPTLTRQAVTVPDESAAGLEARDSLIEPLRLGVKFNVQNATGYQEARRLERFLRNNLGAQVVIPLWTEAVPISAVVDDTITVATATTNRLFSTARFALLWKSATVYELVELSAVNELSVVATENIAGSFVAGDRLVPVLITEPLTASAALDWETSYWTKGGLEFWEDPTAAAALPFTFTPPTAGSITVWPLPLGWTNSLSLGHDRLLVSETADSLVTRATALSAVRATLRAALDLDNRELMARALALHDALGGRRQPLWFTTGKRDFVLVASSSGTTLDVAPTGYVANEWAARLATNDYSRIFVLIRTAAGTWHIRRITNATTLLDGNERLTLNSAVTVTTAAHVSFLLYGRLGFDDLTLEFADSVHAAAAIEFRELPTEYATHFSLSAVNGTINEDGVLLP